MNGPTGGTRTEVQWPNRAAPKLAWVAQPSDYCQPCGARFGSAEPACVVGLILSREDGGCLTYLMQQVVDNERRSVFARSIHALLINRPLQALDLSYPAHPCTVARQTTVPICRSQQHPARVVLKGEELFPANPPSLPPDSRFRIRYSFRQSIRAEHVLRLRDNLPGQRAACHSRHG